ncbi:hypothetical protein N1031_02045 [Herbiconiux moechotypicola]|uniref:Uncharacterized protein n=1 Tax=Herbiconiux moechotypicola TaxID=637393 RepID=A0ABN3D6T3_9MICO|nr:hypothetical protein [Herbiconiux moechotypicola]MCS5728533.1 hypothetical protein [Herbiconiux moechotypicola]
MWRERAALWATIVVATVVLAASVLWAVLAQTLTTPACELPTAPADAGPLVCASAPAQPGS